jgi:hypothetical protein
MENKHETKPTPATEKFEEGHGLVEDAEAVRDANTAKVTIEPKPAEKPEPKPAEQTVNVNVGADKADKKD